jgi:hypothetical protein
MIAQCKMPHITWNIEGLRTHSVAKNMFGFGAPSVVERRWMGWLVYRLVNAARHYNEARQCVLLQVNAARNASNSVSFPIFDFAFAMEDCITSLEKAIVCLNLLARDNLVFASFPTALPVERQQLNSVRRQQEHMQQQLPSGQTGNGSILLTLDEGGTHIRLRDLRMPVASVHALIGEVFRCLCLTHQDFDSGSAAQPAGTLQLTMTAHVEISSGAADPPSIAKDKG